MYVYRAATWLLSGQHEQMQDVLMRYATALSLLDAAAQPGTAQTAGGFAPGMDPGDLSDNILDSAALTRNVAQINNFNAYFTLGMFEQKLLESGKQPCVTALLTPIWRGDHSKLYLQGAYR